MHFQTVATNKLMYLNLISTSVATVLKCMKWLYPYVQVIGVWWWIFGSRSAFKVTRGVQLGLGLSADQSSSSTLTESSFLFDPCLIHSHYHVRIEKSPVQTVAVFIMLQITVLLTLTYIIKNTFQPNFNKKHTYIYINIVITAPNKQYYY